MTRPSPIRPAPLILIRNSGGPIFCSASPIPCAEIPASGICSTAWACPPREILVPFQLFEANFFSAEKQQGDLGSGYLARLRRVGTALVAQPLLAVQRFSQLAKSIGTGL